MADKDHFKQDDYLKSNIHNQIVQSYSRGRPCFSLFLEERELALANEILRHDHCENFLFFGGTDGCERLVLGVFPDEISANPDCFPIKALQINVKATDAQLSHRDYLGAIMSLQIKREHIGDIVVAASSAVIFLSDKVAPFVLQNVEKIGRYSVEAIEADPSGLEIKQEFEDINGTVSSMRLDCIVSMILSKSRRVAEETIASGRVKINGLENLNGAKQLSPSDVVSIRGSGRFIIGEDARKTKKDRLFITIHKLV